MSGYTGAAHSKSSLNHLPRIEDVFRVKGALERAHHVHFRLAFVAEDFFAFHYAQAVFGADRAMKIAHEIVDGARDVVPACEERLVFLAFGHAEIEMDVAVSQMSERHGTHAGDKLRDGGDTLCQKLRHPIDWHSDVVFDRGAFEFLRFRQALAQMPECTALRIVG